MPRLAVRSRAARSLAVGGALVLALSLAACGSQLDPDQVAGQTGGGGTTAQGGEIVPGAPASAGDTTAGGTTGGTTGGATTGGTTGGTTSGGATSGARCRQRWWRRRRGRGRQRRGRRRCRGQLRRLQEPARRHRLRDHHRQRLGHLRAGAGPVRVQPGRRQGLRRLLQLHQRHLRAQAQARHLRQPHRRRCRPAGLHQGLRRGVRDGRLDVGLRLRRRRDRTVLRAAGHPLGRRDQGPQRLHHLLPGHLGQHR